MKLFVKRFVIPRGSPGSLVSRVILWMYTYCREDYRGILARSGKGLDVKLLLSALAQSLEFEHYLEKRFSQHVHPLLINFNYRNVSHWIQSVRKARNEH